MEMIVETVPAAAAVQTAAAAPVAVQAASVLPVQTVQAVQTEAVPAPVQTVQPVVVAAPAEESALRKALLRARAEAECARQGVPSARVPYVLKLAELSGVDPLAEDSAQLIREAIEKVLRDVPELCGTGTGAAGAFPVGREPEPDAFERGFERK